MVDLSSDQLVDGQPPRADYNEIEHFEKKRSGYFCEEYSKTALYWSSLCDLMGENDGSTQAVLTYMSGKLEADRLHSAALYTNADKVFGDKKGQTKLRHDKIRQAEMKAKSKGHKYQPDPESTKAGGPGRTEPPNSSVKALWELTEMDCRAARYSDTLCEMLEQDSLLGKIKAMGKDSSKRFKELADEGDACLVRLRSIDKCVGEAYNKLMEHLGSQIGGKAQYEDVWYLDTRYRTAVVHQKEAWAAVTNKLREVFSNMKKLEAERRGTLRDFLVEANRLVGDHMSKLPNLNESAFRTANALDASQAAVDTDVAAKATTGVEEKRKSAPQEYQLANTTGVICLEDPPTDTSFIDGLGASLESSLIRFKMMVQRRENKAVGSKYHIGLMILTWDGYLHFFDLPESSNLKTDASPSAAFQDLSPSLSLHELMNNKSMEEVLLVKSTESLQMDDDSLVEATKSNKSNKIEVKGSKTQRSVLSSKHKSVTFRTTTEAERNHAFENIKACIQSKGGMQEKSESGYPVQFDKKGSRSSMDSERSSMDGDRPELGSMKAAPAFEPSGAPLVIPTRGNPDIPAAVVYGSKSGSVASFASNPGSTESATSGGASKDR